MIYRSSCGTDFGKSEIASPTSLQAFLASIRRAPEFGAGLLARCFRLQMAASIKWGGPFCGCPDDKSPASWGLY